jgi:hypothetical protein
MNMKNLKLIFGLMLAIGSLATMSALLVGCDDDDEPEALTLVSLNAGSIDLNAATSATGVPVNSTIVAEFSTDVDPATVNAITLTRDFDDTVYPATITVNGSTVTIDPNDDFSTGTLFIVNFGTGLKSTEGKFLTEAVERNFTSEGTFAVPDAVAHWTFEDNADDIIGTFDAPASGIVDITYVDSRKAEAGKAASFNGTTSIIEIPNGDQLMNNGDWSMSIWIKPTFTEGKGHFVLGLGAFYGFQFEIADDYNSAKLAASYAHTNPAGAGTFSEDLWIDGTGNLGWQGWTFSKDYTASGGLGAIIKDQWTHFVFVYDSEAKTGTAYVNGEKAKEQDFDNWPEGDNKTFATGLAYRGVAPEVVNELALGFIQSRAGTLWDNESWGGYDLETAKHFKGLMDDLIIYHKTLSQAEITSMYNSGKP